MTQDNDYLRSAHYQAMCELGYNEEEIEEDYEQLLKDLNLYHTFLNEKAPAMAIQEGSCLPDDAPW